MEAWSPPAQPAAAGRKGDLLGLLQALAWQHGTQPGPPAPGVLALCFQAALRGRHSSAGHGGCRHRACSGARAAVPS